MESPARNKCSAPSIESRSVPRPTAKYSRDPCACGRNTPASTFGPSVVRMNSNSTPGSTGDRILRSQPEGSSATF
jgi:hypothetical protein